MPRPAPSPSSIPLSTFHSDFSKAISAYHKRTNNDLFLHPLAPLFQSCNDSAVALSLLQRHAQVSDKHRISDEQLKSLLIPTLNGLYTISSNGDEGASVGLVLSPEKAILVAIGALLSDAQATRTKHERLVNIFEKMGKSFDLLPTDTSPNANGIILLKVLSIITSATVEIKRGFRKPKMYFKRQLPGKKKVNKALRELPELIQNTSTPRDFQNRSSDSIPHSGYKAPNVATTSESTTNNVGDPRSPTTAVSSNLQWDKIKDAINKWLDPPDLATSLNLVRQARHKGTAKWFFHGHKYEQWKTSGKLFWIHGIPGAGKSTLCSAIVDDIEDTCKSKSNPTNMAYFAFDFKNSHKRTRLDMIPSLLTQLAARSNHCCELLHRLYSAHNRGTQKPTGAVLTDCLKDMVSSPDQNRVYIVIDAIDECPNSPGVPSPREEVLEVLEKLVKSQLPKLRLCVTSRHELDIQFVLEPLQSFSLSLHDEEGQREDIREYIKNVVHSDPSMGKWSPEVRYLVVNTLSERAEGMFRWVSCQLDTLKGALPQTVRHILDGLPKTLDETYESMLMKINMTLRKSAVRLLRCLVAAVKPLLVEELAEILSMNLDDEEAAPKHEIDQRWEDQEQAVLSACASLVDVTEKMDGSRVVHFSHPSVKEFLTSKYLSTSSDRASFYYIRQGSAHKMLAQACLSTLLRLDDQINKDTTKGPPLADYAARYWVDHVHSGEVALLSEINQLFDAQKPHFSAWIAMHDMDEPRVSSSTVPARRSSLRGTPLYYATLCNLYDLAEHLLDVHPEDINVEGGQYTRAIHAALYRGHLSIAHLLIRSGADVNSRDKEGSTPLHIAARIGDTKTMEHLISYRADVNATESGSSCPLFIALKEGNPEAIRLLLDHGADINVRDDKGSTPLHITSRNGLTDLVRYLLDRGADVHAQDNHKSTPLHLASPHRDPTIVQSLIQYGANVNVTDDLGSTALSLAILNDNFKVVKLVIENGADVNIPNNQGQSPLHLAAFQGKLEIVGLLVENGASVNARNRDESTPIHLAFNKRSFRIVEFLVDQGADVTAQDNNCCTPLHFASDDGSLELVQLLIQRGADANARDKKNSTPLHTVSRRGPVEAVKLLLDSGAEIDAQNDKGWTALHIASQEGAVDVVKCLLTIGRANANIGDGDRRTPLHLASQSKNSKIVRLLIEAGADPFARDNRNQIPYQLPSATSQRFLSPSFIHSPSPINSRPARLPSPPPSGSGPQILNQGERHTALIRSSPSSPPPY